MNDPINAVFELAAQNDALTVELERAQRDRAALIHEDNAIKAKLHLTITALRVQLLKPRDAIALLLASNEYTDESAVLDAWATLSSWLIETTPHGVEA